MDPFAADAHHAGEAGAMEHTLAEPSQDVLRLRAEGLAGAGVRAGRRAARRGARERARRVVVLLRHVARLALEHGQAAKRGTLRGRKLAAFREEDPLERRRHA